MTTTCTITKAGRADEYGRPLLVGQAYTGVDAFVESLYMSGYCSVPNVNVFDDDQYPNGSFPAVIPYGSSAVSATTDPVTGVVTKLSAGSRDVLSDFGIAWPAQNAFVGNIRPYCLWQSGDTLSQTNTGGGVAVSSPDTAYPFAYSFPVTAAASDQIQLKKTSITAKPLVLAATDLLIVPIKVSAYAAGSTVATSAAVSLAVSSDNFGAKSGGFTGYWLPSRLGGWSFAVLPASTFTSGNGQLVTDQFNWVGLTIQNTAGGGVFTAQVGGIYVLKASALQQPTLTIQFDDAFASVYTDAYPTMKAYGLVGEIAVIAARVGTGGYCTQAQLLEMQAAGWGLIVHGDTDHGTLSSVATIQADVALNQSYVQGLGGNYLDYVYPAGIIANPNSFTALTNLGFKTSRTVYSITAAGEQHLSSKTAGLSIPAKPINNTTGVTALLTWIDVGIAQGAHIVIYGHRIQAIVDGTIDMTPADFGSTGGGNNLIAQIAQRVGAGRGGSQNGCLCVTTAQWRSLVGMV